MAAARNYVHSLNGELAAGGDFAAELLESFPVVDLDELAELYWDMYTARDGVERVHPEFQAA